MSKISVILLCGGRGTRMAVDKPKQFLEIQGKTIADYSLDVLKKIQGLVEIVVVCDPAYRSFFSNDQDTLPLHFSLPGVRRQDSVLNGLRAIESSPDLVYIHDSARPFINQEMVSRTISAAMDYGAATAAMPIKFTIKEHDGHQFVKNTPDRSLYWEIQTPQVIKLELLKKGFEHVIQHHLTVTDDVSIVELLNLPVKLVEGSYNNLKITTPDDLILADCLLKQISSYG